jgi:hypothetical protein
MTFFTNTNLFKYILVLDTSIYYLQKVIWVGERVLLLLTNFTFFTGPAFS